MAKGDTDIASFENLTSHQGKQVLETHSGVKGLTQLTFSPGSFLKNDLFYMHQYFACMSACTTHACRCPWKPEEGVVFPETGITGAGN